MIELTINDQPITAQPDETVAAVMMRIGEHTFRQSVDGEPRAPLCGMGICNECRVTIDGRPHLLACEIRARQGMKVVTDA